MDLYELGPSIQLLEAFQTCCKLMQGIRNADMPQMLKCLENAPMQAIAGRIWSKLEVLLNFLQIYRLIFVSNVPWPPMW